ncbi:hypothetical protein CAPTEDRAFT_211438, partial [Capitella teleta]
MRTPKTIPAGFISSVPQSDDIESVRPDDGKIWTTTKASKPEIIIALVSAGEEGVLLGRLLVKGDMPGVTVFVKTSENDDFKPVSTKEDQQPKVFESAEGGLINAVMPSKLMATAVKVVPVITEEGAQTISVEDISLFACFTEEFTSVTTTTTGATTTEKTTTKQLPQQQKLPKVQPHLLQPRQLQ